MKEFKIRCSSLHAIMSDPQSYPRDEMSDAELAALKTVSAKRTPEQVAMLEAVMDRSLSEGAKTEVHKLVRYHLFAYEPPELNTKEVRKGLMMEGVAIDLLSVVTGELYTKNTERVSNEWITGEADLLAACHGADTKCPWTAESFPLTSEQAYRMARQAGYEWQMRGYMFLYNKPRWSVCYTLVETPSELIPPFEDSSIHDLAGILPPQHRVTSCWFERDMVLEEKIKSKCQAAQKYAQELIEKFYKEHGE